jgi:hypothetical protein
MAYKAPKPTKAQLAEGKARASASGIAMNQSAKGLRNASKVIIAGASMLPAGRVVKAASTASKMAKTADARRKFDAANERRILDNQVKKSVKVLPRKTAPKTDLSSRGNKITLSSQKKAANKIQEDKWEKYVDQRFDTYPGGPRADFNMANKGRGASPKKIVQHKAIEKAATKKQLIKINSQRNLKKK